MFRDDIEDMLDGQWQREEYFSRFAPWENEQLACIHDYLLRIMRPVFEEVEEIDRRWVYYLDIPGGPDGCYQHHLSLGLGHIRRFAEAKTPEARCSLLSYDTARYGNPLFLANAFIYSTTSTEVHLKDFGPAHEEIFIHQPCYPDSDSGPEDVWRWAHHSQRTGDFVCSLDQKHLRHWMYVMWDRIRLVDWGILRSPWEVNDECKCELMEDGRFLLQT